MVDSSIIEFLSQLRMGSTCNYEDVIEGNLSEPGDYICSYFSLGECGRLPDILHKRFPNKWLKVSVIRGELGEHVVVEEDGVLYDIFGVYDKPYKLIASFNNIEDWQAMDVICNGLMKGNYDKSMLIKFPASAITRLYQYITLYTISK